MVNEVSISNVVDLLKEVFDEYGECNIIESKDSRDYVYLFHLTHKDKAINDAISGLCAGKPTEQNALVFPFEATVFVSSMSGHSLYLECFSPVENKSTKKTIHFNSLEDKKLKKGLRDFIAKNGNKIIDLYEEEEGKLNFLKTFAKVDVESRLYKPSGVLDGLDVSVSPLADGSVHIKSANGNHISVLKENNTVLSISNDLIDDEKMKSIMSILFS